MAYRFKEFFRPSVDVDACALKDPNGAVCGKVEFAASLQAAGFLVVVSGRREGQAFLGEEGHISDYLERLPIFGIIGLCNTGIDGDACGDAGKAALFHPAPKALNEGARFELRGA